MLFKIKFLLLLTLQIVVTVSTVWAQAEGADLDCYICIPHYNGRNRTIQDYVRIEADTIARELGVPKSSLRSCEEFRGQHGEMDRDRGNEHGNQQHNQHGNQQSNQHGNQHGNQQGNQHSNQQGNQQGNQHDNQHGNRQTSQHGNEIDNQQGSQFDNQQSNQQGFRQNRQHSNQQSNQHDFQQSRQHSNQQSNLDEQENVHGEGSKVSEFQKMCGKKDNFECYLKEFNSNGGNGSESESWISRGCMEKSRKSSIQNFAGLSVHYCGDDLCNSSRFGGFGWLEFLLVTLVAIGLRTIV